jgi:hypothetical protein
MTRFECIVAALGPGLAVPAFLAAGGEAIRRAFREGSGGEIEVAVDTSPLARPFSLLDRHGKARERDLHAVVREVTGNAVNARKVNRIALLIGDRYDHPGVFGAMFDLGAARPNDLRGPPREGCAVFVGEIARLRRDRARAVEELFTCVHELGHVFNLWHVQQPWNFMSRSPLRQPVDDRHHLFLPDHAQLLGARPLAETTWPGGSPFLGGSHHMLASGARSAADGAPIELRVALSRRELFAFEPLELDLGLVARSAGASWRTLPDELDPGYDRFRIWIETPEGERRYLRPSTLYCRSHRSIKVTGSESLRDVHLSWDRDGPVLRAVGPHRLWVELDLGRRGRLRSNDVEVEVKPSSAMTDVDKALQRLLARPGARTLQQHKLDRTGGRLPRLLERFAADQPRHPALSQLRYCLGRAYLERAGILAEDAEARGALRRKAVTHLEPAADDDAIGEHRRRRCNELLRSLGVRRRASTSAASLARKLESSAAGTPRDRESARAR